MVQKGLTKIEEEFVILMRDMNFDKEQAIGLLLFCEKHDITQELVRWLKANPKANQEDAFAYAFKLYDNMP